jgi:hypothetical protein
LPGTITTVLIVLIPSTVALDAAMAQPHSFALAERRAGAVAFDVPMARWHGLVVSGVTRFFGSSLVTATLAAVVLVAGCGSPSASASAPRSVGPGTADEGSTPAAPNSGGVADTPTNPDRSYLCAAVTNGGTGGPIAYLTVAGSDETGARTECSAVPQSSGWTAIASSPFHETQYTPVCFLIFDGGRLTLRVYTSDSGTFAEGVALCNPLLQQFAVPTLPPS